MGKSKDNLSISDWAPSKRWGAKVLYAALLSLKENGGELPIDSVLASVEKNVLLDEWAKEQYQKTGYIRWQSLLHFFSIDAVKSGFLVKKKGVWYLTPEGEKTLTKGEAELFIAAQAGYKKWRANNPKAPDQNTKNEDSETEPEFQADTSYAQAEIRSKESIKNFINSKNAYEFQDLSAALLRGMGYYTPFVSPKGKDGGIDIIAYKDPLGTSGPRIKAQVKHRDKSADVKDVRELLGLLSKDGDTGLIISSGGFTPDAKQAARNASIHIELVDLDRFIDLWQEFFYKLPDEDQSLLPIIPIYFLNAA